MLHFLVGIQCICPGMCGCSTNCHQGTCWNGQFECFEGYTGHDCSHYNPKMYVTLLYSDLQIT